MRCSATARHGAPCRRPALVDGQLCAAHAGRCGARPGNRNAVRHGLYSKQLTPEEQFDLVDASTIESLSDEIGMTRLMILRALRQQDPSAQTYTRLVGSLCRQLHLQRQLTGQAAEGLAQALAALLDELATNMGLIE